MKAYADANHFCEQTKLIPVENMLYVRILRKANFLLTSSLRGLNQFEAYAEWMSVIKRTNASS